MIGLRVRPCPVALLTSLALALALLTAAWAPAQAEAKPNKGKPPVPAIFVHGNFGSAQQFETNAMRFTSNGYPHDRLFAYEYDTTGPRNEVAIANLEPFIADVMAKTGAPQVDILAHSRGTTVMHEYLRDPERAATVRRYVNFDGRTAAEQPGGVPTLAIWGEGDQTRAIGGAMNVYFPNKAHTEVTTSREAFGPVYNFLTGKRPKTKQVVPEKPRKVTVAGRATVFPANSGNEGALLEVYELDSATGQRKPGGPLHSVPIGADGSFGPLPVHGKRHYEFAVSKVGAETIHNYPEPFERDDHFYRVQDSVAIRTLVESGPNHTSLAVLRMREFWGDQADPGWNDKLSFNGVNVITPGVAPRARRVIAVFAFDKNSDRATDTSTSLFPFNQVSFLTGVDVYLPSRPDASGTIAVEETMRGKRRHRETINVPNWPSDNHGVSVYFKDYAAKAYRRR